MIEMLRDRHAGQTAWIIGKGPSLASLRAEHICQGPVLTLNSAIEVVGALGLPHTYSLQNDGCSFISADERRIGKPDCDMCDKQEHWPLVRPRLGVTLLLNHVYPCMPDFEPRYTWDALALGFEAHDAMVVRVAVAVAKVMGCVRIEFVACDSLTNDDLRTCEGGTVIEYEDAAQCYSAVHPFLLHDLEDIPHGFVTPC